MIELSPREKQVVDGIVAGQKNQEIADDLGLTLETVKTYISRIRLKVGVRTKTQIAVWCLQNGDKADRAIRNKRH